MLPPTSVDGDAEKVFDVPSPDVPDALTPEQLARAVRQRRAELRMSQEDVRRQVGLSITTVGKIERGDPDNVVQAATLRRLDVALGWPTGTAESWYHGRGGIVPAGPATDIQQLAADLLPLIHSALLAEREEHPVLSLEGLPKPVAATLERLVREIRNAIVHG